MSWQDTLVTILRNLIGDLSSGSAQKYTDDQLAESIVVAGLITSQEYPFESQYTFDLFTPNITPDPTVTPTVDNQAMALWTLKAACIINTNAFQLAVGAGIKVRDGDSEVDTTAAFRGYADVLKLGPCASYAALLKTLYTRASMNQGRAVMGPTGRNHTLWGNTGPIGNWSARGFFDYFLRY